MASRYSSGITAPTQELEPSPIVVFFKKHANKVIGALMVVLAGLSLATLIYGYALLAFLLSPIFFILYSLTNAGEGRRYEVTRQSIVEAITLPSYAPAGFMSVTWLVLDKLANPTVATFVPLVVPFLFIPYFKRVIRNHRKSVWNNMVHRLELAAMEHVPYARVDLRSVTVSSNGVSPYDEAEWDTGRRRQAFFDAWLAVDLPLQRKLDLMAGGITPERALDPDVVAMTADDLLTLKAMESLALASPETSTL